MKKVYFLLLIIFVSTSCNSPKDDWNKIHLVMEKQAEDWNKGDIEGYMQGYWNSPDLKFIGRKGLTKGWQETLDRYKTSYPDQKVMGILKFTYLNHEPVGTDHYQVIGNWHLSREQDTLQGHFTLLWKNFEGSWFIISDHSS